MVEDEVVKRGVAGFHVAHLLRRRAWTFRLRAFVDHHVIVKWKGGVHRLCLKNLHKHPATPFDGGCWAIWLARGESRCAAFPCVFFVSFFHFVCGKALVGADQAGHNISCCFRGKEPTPGGGVLSRLVGLP